MLERPILTIIASSLLLHPLTYLSLLLEWLCVFVVWGVAFFNRGDITVLGDSYWSRGLVLCGQLEEKDLIEVFVLS